MGPFGQVNMSQACFTRINIITMIQIYCWSKFLAIHIMLHDAKVSSLCQCCTDVIITIFVYVNIKLYKVSDTIVDLQELTGLATYIHTTLESICCSSVSNRQVFCFIEMTCTCFTYFQVIHSIYITG